MKTALLFAAGSFFLAATCFLYGESGIGTALLGLGSVLSLVGFGPSPETVADGEGE